RFVTIDTETTGFHAYAGDEIVSVALLELQGLELTGRRYATLIDPDRPIPAASSEIHRVRDEDVRGCPSIREALPDILDFIGDAVLIGHHVGFDLRFLNKNLQKYLLCRLCNPWIDTMLLFTTYTGRMAHYGLDEVAEFCRVPVHGRHTAVGDAQATAKIFAVLAARLIRQAQPVQALIGQQFQSGHEI
ncbi:MAG: 3'-5' exonuclease, partial [Gammaproteobacteria bacterium]|nr:3'-5' exonuclease [Gammaproteobacteria bacterium]